MNDAPLLSIEIVVLTPAFELALKVDDERGSTSLELGVQVKH